MTDKWHFAHRTSRRVSDLCVTTLCPKTMPCIINEPFLEVFLVFTNPSESSHFGARGRLVCSFAQVEPAARPAVTALLPSGRASSHVRRRGRLFQLQHGAADPDARTKMAVGPNPWYHCGVGAPPLVVSLF